ncbi:MULTISPECIES: hypothetical protein [Streptomyces]|uniref:ATP-dependent DNA ligase family profile domain-containing protein n=1 Tax=Streptomyces changanensis TaxID=2964669 RepID=A0ABY5NGE0_9ACTN|nr:MULTISPECIES: hypothetical protein [Streptomyces]UUS35034.1 hypothetical protein NRO40_28615 [Streptomyces changanensis]
MPARPATALPAPGARPMLFEQKADGFHVLVFTGPQPYLQSRRGADLGPAFPELVRAAAAAASGRASSLDVEAVLDAELAVWRADGLDLPTLQERARRRGATAGKAASERPAHLIVFDVLEMSGAQVGKRGSARPADSWRVGRGRNSDRWVPRSANVRCTGRCGGPASR